MIRLSIAILTTLAACSPGFAKNELFRLALHQPGPGQTVVVKVESDSSGGTVEVTGSEGIRSGKIDVICSNHDPHDVDTKRLPFAEAADGAIGLESLLAASLRLYHTDDVPLVRILNCLSTAPAKRLGLESGTLAIGAPADLILFDPDMPWVLKEEELRSRSRNTAFEGARFQGRVLKTFIEGRTVFSLDD